MRSAFSPARRRRLGKGPGAGPPAGGEEEGSAPADAPAGEKDGAGPAAAVPSGTEAGQGMTPRLEKPAAEDVAADAPVGEKDGAGPAAAVPSGTEAGQGMTPRLEKPAAEDAEGAAAPRPETPAAAECAAADPAADGRFTVRLDNFEGPFDLLLQLIAKHKLDVTEVALSKVTDEFMAHIRAMGPDFDLDQTTEFLVVAATLLDLKAARLLPAAEVEDEADLALLEARDLLFARLLQYRAYKRVAEIFSARLDDEAHRFPRTVGLEPHHAELLPEVVLGIGPERLAELAVKAMRPKPAPQVYVDHIHAPLVSVREQAEVVVARLRGTGRATFGELTGDAPDTLTVVARFLALLELYRERAVALDQDEALGELSVRWTGEEGAEPLVTDEFDRAPETGPEEPEESAQ